MTGSIDQTSGIYKPIFNMKYRHRESIFSSCLLLPPLKPMAYRVCGYRFTLVTVAILIRVVQPGSQVVMGMLAYRPHWLCVCACACVRASHGGNVRAPLTEMERVTTGLIPWRMKRFGGTNSKGENVHSWEWISKKAISIIHTQPVTLGHYLNAVEKRTFGRNCRNCIFCKLFLEGFSLLR